MDNGRENLTESIRTFCYFRGTEIIEKFIVPVVKDHLPSDIVWFTGLLTHVSLHQSRVSRQFFSVVGGPFPGMSAVRCRNKAVDFLQSTHERRRVPFENSKSDLCSVAVIAVLYVMSWYRPAL